MAKKSSRKSGSKMATKRMTVKKSLRKSSASPKTGLGAAATQSPRRKRVRQTVRTSSEQDESAVRYSIETGIEQIENDQLTAADIPARRADWNAIRHFAYSFDGYDHDLSTSDCGEIGNGLRQAYLANRQISDTLTNLRVALFFEARRYHHFGTSPDSSSMKYIRAVVEELRKTLS